VEQGARHGQLLLHAAAPGADVIAAAVVQAKALQQFFRARPALRGIHVPHAAVKLQVILGGQALVQAGVLQQRAALFADLVTTGAGIQAKHLGAPGGRLQQTQQQANGGGFSGAVGAEKAEHDAGGYFKADSVHSVDAAKVPRKLVGADDRVHRCYSFEML